MKLKTHMAVALSVSMGLMSMSACQSKKMDKPVVPVKVVAVELNPAGNGSRYSATIIPRTEVELAFKVAGYVDALQQVRGVDGRVRDVQEGDRISVGAVIARIRQSDYQVKVRQAESQASEAISGIDASKAQYQEALSNIASSKSQLAEAEASYVKAKFDYDRAQNLFATQSMTKANYDAARAQFELTTAQVETARSQIRMIQSKGDSAKANINAVTARSRGAQAVVQETRIPLQDTALRSPLNGIVLEKSIEKGTLVSAGTKAFTVADMSSVKAVFGVADMAVPEMKLGRTLLVESETMPGKEFRGQITSVFPAADQKSRAFNVEVTIQNPEFLLRPNMIVSLKVETNQTTSAQLVVSLDALMKAKDNPNGYQVFVVQAQGGHEIARLSDVKLGQSYGNTVAVTEGLKEGERVLTTGVTIVNDGDQVKVIP